MPSPPPLADEGGITVAARSLLLSGRGGVRAEGGAGPLTGITAPPESTIVSEEFITAGGGHGGSPLPGAFFSLASQDRL